MKERVLGRSGLRVSALGLGCGPMGDLPQAEAVRLVHTALDLGVRVFDCAPSYGAAEESLGQALRGVRRSAFVLIAKGGYGVDGVPDWSADAVAKGIDQALSRLGCDTLDVFMLHSCDRERLQRGDLLEPLVRARASGKVRAVGYAGDGPALEYAIGSSAFDVVECSVNLFDQRALTAHLPHAQGLGLGVVAKRALGNAPWCEPERPSRFDAGLYWDRMRAMFAQPPGRAWTELAVRFATFAPGVDCALVGTRSAVHLAAAVEAAERGALDESSQVEVRQRFQASDAGWEGVV